MDSGDKHPDFGWLLTDGVVWTQGSTRFSIAREDGPELVLPTGQLAASGFGSGEPFVEAVQPGKYRTTLFSERRAELKDDGVTVNYYLDSVAALRITIHDSPVAAWEPAMVASEDPDYHNKSNTFGVDGGVGVVCDGALADTFLNMSDFLEPFKPTKSPSLLAGIVDADTGANALCIMYEGDGVHDSWIGRNADGAIACFVIV